MMDENIKTMISENETLRNLCDEDRAELVRLMREVVCDPEAIALIEEMKSC